METGKIYKITEARSGVQLRERAKSGATHFGDSYIVDRPFLVLKYEVVENCKIRFLPEFHRVEYLTILLNGEILTFVNSGTNPFICEEITC